MLAMSVSWNVLVALAVAAPTVPFTRIDATRPPHPTQHDNTVQRAVTRDVHDAVSYKKLATQSTMSHGPALAIEASVLNIMWLYRPRVCLYQLVYKARMQQ